MLKNLRELFTTPVDNRKKQFVILWVAILFIFAAQVPPVDWDLNIRDFWSNFPHVYQNSSVVYPPWALILLLPHRLIFAEGTRFLSVLVIGWLVVQNRWSLSTFFSIVLTVYFRHTMAKSNMDILVMVFPILLWKQAAGTRWQNLAWGFSLATLLVKPQVGLFIAFYLLWQNRRQYRELLLPLAITALAVIPISLAGSPPLIWQWLDNLRSPSVTNQFYWSINNVSLTAKYSLLTVVLILSAAALFLFAMARAKIIRWTENHTTACVMLAAMFLLPYTSQQSAASALAFIPSWGGVIIQNVATYFALHLEIFVEYEPLWLLLFAISGLLMFRPRGAQTEPAAQDEITAAPAGPENA